MKSLRLLLIAILLSSSAFGQTPVTNQFTKEHQEVAGTKISLIPPEGFIVANNFLGFQQSQSGSTIMVLDIPGPFSETSKGLTKEGLLSQGVEVKNIESLIFNNLPGVLVSAEQNAHGSIYTKYILAFGSEKETIILNGAFPNNLKNIGELIKKSMLSSYYEPEKKINPFDHVDYTIDLKSSKLVFAKGMANALLFNLDGNMPTKAENKSSLIIAKSFSEMDIEDRKLFSINRLKQLPVEISTIEKTKELKIDDISGYEIIALGKDKKTGETEKIYQVILFSDNQYYIFYGSTNFDLEKNIKDIETVIKSFKRK